MENYDHFSDFQLSVISEIGNILAGSYVNAMSAMTNLNIWLSPPQVAIDMVGAILSFPAAQFGAMGDKLLFIEEDFLSGEETIKSHLLIMPDLKSLNKILPAKASGFCNNHTALAERTFADCQ